MNSEHNNGERNLKLPNGTRKHIRKLKAEGNLKEAILVRNAAIDLKNSLRQKPDAKPGDSGD